MDTKRLILFVVFSFSIMMLWEAWQRDHMPQQTTQDNVAQSVPAAPAAATANTPAATAPEEAGFRLQPGDRLRVHTDFIDAEIDSVGGDLRRLELIKHRATNDMSKNFVLLDDRTAPHVYIAQSGLIG